MQQNWLMQHLDTTPTPVPDYTPTEEEREEARQRRVANCGKHYHRLNPSNGAYFSYRMTCGYWRRCPDCLAQRRDMFEARFQACLDQAGDWLRILQTDNKTSIKVIRTLRDSGTLYWRIPTAEGVIIIFDSFHHPEIPGNLSPEDLDWMELCQTPERKKYSGKLGQPEEEEEDQGESFIVEVWDTFFTYPKDVTFQDIYDEAIYHTRHLNPTFDPDEIQKAINERGLAFVEAIEVYGGEIADERVVRIRVSKSSYKNWLIEANRVVEEVEKRQECAESVPKQPEMTAQDAINELFDFVE